MTNNLNPNSVPGKRKSRMRIAVICGFPFPVGYSGTNRILSYTKGLTALGCDVSVFIYRKTENQKKAVNEEARGVFDGVKFEYPGKQTVKSRVKLILAANLLFDYLKTAMKIIFRQRITQFDALIISDDNPFLVWLFSLAGAWAKLKKVVLIVDEYPKPLRDGGIKISSFSRFLFQRSEKRLHGLICISTNIQEFYKNLLKRDLPSIIVPIMVDNDRFSGCAPEYDDCITCIGSLDNDKDGLDILLRAFSVLSQYYPELKLKIIGDGKDKSSLIEIAVELGIGDKVDFSGYVRQDLIPDLLKKSRILCLARPATKRAEGGFPTKLGEYLASGNPVLVTAVGDIPLYLKHKENAYLARPGDVNDFAEKMFEILDDYEKAKEVGKKGQELAATVFDSGYQAQRMLDFLIGI